MQSVSPMSFTGIGGASYLQVLTSETNSLRRRTEPGPGSLKRAPTLVQLYNALGGGWQQ